MNVSFQKNIFFEQFVYAKTIRLDIYCKGIITSLTILLWINWMAKSLQNIKQNMAIFLVKHSYSHFWLHYLDGW